MVNFKQLLEKATNGDLSEPDWETILEIVEDVKTKNISAKNAMREFRKRLLDSSGNSVYLTLLVLDSLMKNCASDVHAEVLCVEFMTVLKTVITTSKDGKSEKAVDKALELIGEWKTAFGDQTGYKAINTVYSELEREGYHIPMAQVASAAFIKKAPEWVLSDRCFMCRQEFNRFKGKLRHHCRNCGKSVCAPCSGKRVALAHFGVEEPTRVCDICYKKVEKGEGASAAAAAAEMDKDLPVEYLRSSLAQESQTTHSPSPAATQGGAEQEEDELQLAIAMSLNEQENKPKKTSPAPVTRRIPSPVSTPRSATPSAPPHNTLYASIVHDPSPETYSSHQPHSHLPPVAAAEPSNDPLARYLDRNYWEQRKEQQASGAPPTSNAPVLHVSPQQPVVVPTQSATPKSGGNPLAESIRNSITMFVNRLHELNSNGSSIATDPVVLSLYQNLTAMQPQLLKQVDEIQQQKAKQLAIINKLNEAKEARVTLNKMRRDHQDKVKQMEQEQAMLARMQMEQKLALLRQQKQEQLEFQQSLQHKRLEVLQTQRVEYEQKVAMQRELERQQLIAQEHKVLQHQFGGQQQQQQQQQVQPQGQYVSPLGGQYPSNQYSSSQQQQYASSRASGGSPQPLRKLQTQQFATPSSVNMDPSSLSLQPMTLHDPTQALPLPPKLEYNPTTNMDSMAPPPYNPTLSEAPPTSMYTAYQAPPTTTTQPLNNAIVPQGNFDPTSIHPSQMVQQSLPPLRGHLPPSGQPGQPSLHQPPPPSLTGQPSLSGHLHQPPGQPLTGQPSLQQPPSLPGQPLTGQPSLQQPPSLPGQPLTGQPSLQQPPSLPGQPLTGQPSLPGQPLTGQPSIPGQPLTGQPSLSGQPLTGQPSLPGQPLTGQHSLPGQPLHGQPLTGQHSLQSTFLPGGNFTPPTAGGQQQYQESVVVPSSSSTHLPPISGYQGYHQPQYPQQQGGAMIPNGAHQGQGGAVIPNGAHQGMSGTGRETEPSLISFD